MILTSVIGGLFGDVLGSVVDDVARGVGGVSAREASAAAVSRVAGYLGEPRNHDVARAIRLAQLNAARAVLQKYRPLAADPKALSLDYLNRYLNAQIGLCPSMAVRFDPGSGPALARAVNVTLTGRALPEPGQVAPPEALDRRAAAEAAALGELRQGVRQHPRDSIVLDPGYEAAFLGRLPAVQGWFALFTAFLGREVKVNARFRDMFNATQVAELVLGQGRTEAALQALAGRWDVLEAALDRVEAKLEAVLLAVQGITGVPAQRLLAEATRGAAIAMDAAELGRHLTEWGTRFARIEAELGALRAQLPAGALPREARAEALLDAGRLAEAEEALAALRGLAAGQAEQGRLLRRLLAARGPLLGAGAAIALALMAVVALMVLRGEEAERRAEARTEAARRQAEEHAAAIRRQAEDQAAAARRQAEQQEAASQAARALAAAAERASQARLSALEERLLAAIAQGGVGRRAEDARLEQATILALARRLKPDEVQDFDQAVAALTQAVEIALDTIARGERAASDDAFLDRVMADVAARTRAGDFDAAARSVDEGLAELDRRAAEQRAAAQRRRVALLQAGISQDVFRRDAPAVARREAMLAAAQAEFPAEAARPEWAPSYAARREAYFDEGVARGLGFPLLVAVEMARRQLADAADAGERAHAGIKLGQALQALGTREGGTAHLEQATTVLTAVVDARPRELKPTDWWAAQNALGSVLALIGEREAGTARLEAAAAAFTLLLEQTDPKRQRADWATAQNNLGLVLHRMGERESGPARLEAAIAALRLAAAAHSRDAAPQEWAATMNNLGLSLQALGAREAGSARLKEAILAFRQALEERRRDRVPLEWAVTQHNLGTVLLALAPREANTARLREAVEAFRLAAEEMTRERAPLDWAMAQVNTGIALTALGGAESDPALLEEAVAAFRLALEEMTRERVPLGWATAQGNLGAALREIGLREPGTARLEEAVAAFDAYLDVAGTVSPEAWLAWMRRMRAETLEEIAARRGGR